MNKLKENIEFYLPSLIEIVNSTNLDWEIIDKLFSKEIKNRKVKANGEILLVQATIYDIIVEVKKGNLQALRLLSFFQRLLEELSNNLSFEEQKMIKKNIRDFLISFNQSYLNYVGELAVINNIIKSKKYSLEKVETELVSKSRIDFTIRNLDDGKLLLVEVVNIHLNSDKVESDEEKIRKFLDYRLSSKIESKKSTTSFFLVPVLWGDWKDIKIYSEYFKRNKMHLENVLEPVSYVTFIDTENENYYRHHFGNVSNLFD